MANWLAQAVDNVGTALNLPGLGISEFLNGGQATSNTGRINETGINNVVKGAGIVGPAIGIPQNNNGGSSGGAVSVQNGGSGGSDVLGSNISAPGGGASLPALNQSAINNTQTALDQLPALLQAALEAEATRKANTLRGFNDQEAGQRKTYDGSTTTNQQNYDANYMDSIRSGIKGLGGLFNILRGTGAAGGTAEDLVRDTVGGVTASDIRTGADTQQQNQTSLDSALSNFLTELKGKRQSAEDTFENNQRAIQRDNATQMQDLYSKMAGFYGDGGRTAEAQNFMAKAGNLTPTIARNSMTQQSAYDTKPVAVQAPQLTAFSAPTQPDVSVVTPDQLGSGIFTMNRKREEQATPVALPVGA